MTIKSGFFNSIAGDRKYDAEDINKFFDGVIVEGVLSAIGDIFLVSPSSGLTVAIGSGKAWFLRSWIENTADAFLTLSTADVTYDRIDIIALDFDKSDQVRENDIIVVEGTPASSPVPPTLIDTATHLQKPLAHILVGVNETVIDVGDITIKVDTVDCPFSAGIVELVVEVDNVTIQIIANELSVIDDGITGLQIANLTVDTEHIANSAVETLQLASLAVNASKIANNTITAGQIAAQAVDTLELADDAVTEDKIAPGAIGEAFIADGAVTAPKLGPDAVTAAKIGNDVINSEHYAALSVDREHLAADVIDGTKLANDSVNSEHIVADSIDSEHYALNSVDSGALGTSAVGNAQLGPDAVTQAKIQDNALRSEHYSDGSIDKVHLAGDVIDHTKIEDDALRSEHYGFASIDNEHLAADIIDDDNINLRVPIFPKRQGGHASDWGDSGTGNYTPGEVMMLGGEISFGAPASGGSANLTINFPRAFDFDPLVFLQLSTGASAGIDVTFAVHTISPTTANVTAYNNGPSAILVLADWLAIGPGS